MLWYKAWLETRWRMLLMLGVILFVLTRVPPHGVSPLQAGAFPGALELLWLITPLMLASSGTRTDSPFRAMKGLQGSIHFTLSMPVSRRKLLVSRAIFGLLATAAIMIAGCAMAIAIFPEVREQVGAVDALKYGLTVFLCSSAAYGVSTVFATLMDQQWQAFASMFVILGGRWLFDNDGPSSLNFFHAMGNTSPLVTHAMPWPAVLTAVIIAAVCLAAALRIEQSRQY